MLVNVYRGTAPRRRRRLSLRMSKRWPFSSRGPRTSQARPARSGGLFVRHGHMSPRPPCQSPPFGLPLPGRSPGGGRRTRPASLRHPRRPSRRPVRLRTLRCTAGPPFPCEHRTSLGLPDRKAAAWLYPLDERADQLFEVRRIKALDHDLTARV